MCEGDESGYGFREPLFVSALIYITHVVVDIGCMFILVFAHFWFSFMAKYIRYIFACMIEGKC